MTQEQSSFRPVSSSFSAAWSLPLSPALSISSVASVKPELGIHFLPGSKIKIFLTSKQAGIKELIFINKKQKVSIQ